MRFTLICLSLAIALPVLEGSAQVNPEAFGYYNEALLFSQTRFNGSARIQAIGGAQVALGGDISSATSNPAGLGFFNRSQFSLSPSLNFHNSDATFDGNTVNTESENFNIGQLGVVINKSKEDNGDGFRGGSFAFTMQRTNSFKQQFNYDGFNDNNSIIDYFLSQGNGIPFTVLENEDLIFDSGTELVSLAYNHFLINPVDGFNDQYDSFIIGFPRQQESVKVKGSQYQWNFAGGGNYMDKIYFGAGIGIATMNYKITKTYRESEFVTSDGMIDDAINDLYVDEETDIDGIGVNLNVGVIFRPFDVMTVGLSYVSPTWYEINDETFNDLETNYNDFDYNGEILGSFFTEGRIFASNYSLRTPSKLNLGVAYFIGKNGFLTGDVEMVDYSGANLGSDDFSTTPDNQTISGLYQRAVNYRLGGEYRIDRFMLRAGYAYFGDPLADSSIDGDEQRISFGAGYRTRKFFADLAVINARANSSYSPYVLPDNGQPVVDVENKSTNVMLTFGVNF